MKIKNIQQLLKDDSGAVMMEYVIIGVLIATACLLAVVVLSRAIFYGFDKAQVGATGDSATVKKIYSESKEKLENDIKDAGEYHDSMHTGK